MTLLGWCQIVLFFLIIVLLTKPMGRYLYRLFEDQEHPLPYLRRVETWAFRACGIDAAKTQSWQSYAAALIVFSALGVLITYLVQRLQGLLPLNPQGLPAVPSALAFNAASSFVSNTNWQSYSGESTMSYLTQMSVLTWQNFVSAAAGLGVALALARGLTRHGGEEAGSGLGNFWVDLIRGVLWVLLPICVLSAVLFVAGGVIQNFSPYHVVQTLEGTTQTLAMGPVASQEAIKLFGTNGGGFFNANSAHPFENPTPLTNFLQLVLIFILPAGLTYMYGMMTRDTRQGWALFATMSVLFFAGVAANYAAEAQPNRGFISSEVRQGPNMEGKESRFGISASALFATVTTDASCGAVNAMHDSFNPLGGLVPMVNMQLGEVIFGGVGAGLYGMLVFVLLAVFIAGLMVGRTPEYLGKKVEAREMKLAVLYILIYPFSVLTLAAIAAVRPEGLSSLTNAGPHGLSEMLYAYSSAAGNNGSAFAGLNANTPFWNGTLAFSMLAGRFLMIVPALGIAGSMLPKKVIPTGPGTFPTHGTLFIGLLTAVVIVVGALTFFPALSLGPIVEHFLAAVGKGV